MLQRYSCESLRHYSRTDQCIR